MNLNVFRSGLAIDSPITTSDAINYRPTSWPPAPNWPVIVDAHGIVVSYWGDTLWRLDPWAGKPLTLNFGDGDQTFAPPISPDNAHLLRLVVTWWLYSPNAVFSSRQLKTRFDQIRVLFVLCTHEGIKADTLVHFPRVAEILPARIQSSRKYEFLAIMHELYRNRDELGFTLLDIKTLTSLAAALPDHEKSQTPYMPPRIWKYQVMRLHECLEDFIKNKEQLISCYRYCLKLYNTRSNLNQDDNSSVLAMSSYINKENPTEQKKTSITNYEGFYNIAKKFSILELLEKWVGDEGRKISLAKLATYFSLISKAGLGYILNFSLMRVEEAWNLHTDCLKIEKDKDFGDIYLLMGETTKTLSDSNTFWITSPSVTIAVEAMRIVAELRTECNSSGSTKSSDRPGFLIGYANEPWSKQRRTINVLLRPSIPSYERAFECLPKVFEPEKMKITENDLRLARLATPTLPDRFSVGAIWPLAWHQLRRTGAVNMQASGLVSDSSLQFQLKHITRAMSLYYGQNYSKIKLEEKAQSYYVKTMYETLGKELQHLTSKRFCSPYGDKRKSNIIHLVSLGDAEKIQTLVKKGLLAYRSVLLGVCTNREPCPYGGIDNIAHCGGGDAAGKVKPCSNILYDKTRLTLIDKLNSILDDRLKIVEPGSPLAESLEAQKRSVENYRNVIKKTK